MEDNITEAAAVSRREILKPVKRVVIKVGSGVLTLANGLNLEVVDDMSQDIFDLRKAGIEVILVSSGAIASGFKKIGFSQRPQSVSQQQAMAAIGMPSLMKAYEKAFSRFQMKVAQILLTRDDLTHRRRYLNARNTLYTLLSWDILPIINENDTVVVDEIKFGDNDNLCAMVTNLSEAQLLVNLTNIDGLYDKDPRDHKDAKLIKCVEKVNREISEYASTIPGFLGKGGMASKVKAAQQVSLRGVPTIIANGLKPGIIRHIFEGGEEGTLFMPEPASLCSRKHWILFTKSPKGEIVIDKGASNALRNSGKSLLPSGIRDVRGRFSQGDSVLLKGEDDKEIAVGMVNYHSEDISRIMGCKTSEIESKLGFRHDDEVIHRDNMVLADQMEDGEELCQLRT